MSSKSKIITVNDDWSQARGIEGQTITVTLVRSRIGASDTQRGALDSLTLRKIGDNFTGVADGSLLGQVNKLAHLVSVTTAE